MDKNCVKMYKIVIVNILLWGKRNKTVLLWENNELWGDGSNTTSSHQSLSLLLHSSSAQVKESYIFSRIAPLTHATSQTPLDLLYHGRDFMVSWYEMTAG